MFYYGLPVTDLPYLFERKSHPTMQHTSAHRRDRAVDNIVERPALLCLTACQLQITDSEAVQPYVFIFFYTAKMLNMTRLQVLRHIEIHQNTSCSRDACRHLIQTESFE